jgi:parallel beta-helix repeat protein
MKTLRHTAMKRLLTGVQLFALLVFTHGAWAQAVACVSNDTQLAVALSQAQFVPLTVKLVQGSYNLHSSPWSGFGYENAIVQGGTQLLGGYTASCAGRNIAAGNTILDDSAGEDTLILHGNLTLEGLTIRTRLSISANNIGDGDFGPLPGNIDLPPNTEVLLRRDEFTGGGSVVVDWEQDDDIGGTIRVVDTLIVGNNGACSVQLDNELGGTPSLELINDTIVDNTSGYGVCIYDHFDGHSDHGNPSLFAYNSIFYGNQVDIYDEDSAVFLIDNVIGTHNYPGFLINAGTLTGDPKLNSNYRPIESPPSPIINSGTSDVRGGLPASDLDGGSRMVGSAPDRGAYESNVDDAFILSVTNTHDSGAGSLREAITSANSNGGFNIIEFAIGTGCGPHVITLDSALPNITSSVLINGYTQTGSVENDLEVGDDAVFCIVLDGNTNTIGNGFNVPTTAANGVALTVEGIAFSGFTNAAIKLNGGGGHVIEGVRIGGSTSGGALDPVFDGIDVGSGVSGVTIGGSDNDKRNIIGDALNNGIYLEGSGGGVGPAHNNQIINNYIGVGWNPSTGKFTNLGIVGGALFIQGRSNTISGNLFGFDLDAIDLYTTDAHDNLVSGNYIGISPLGDDLDDTGYGVEINQDAHDNTVSGNTIANNAIAGVVIGNGQHNLISANSLHDNYCGIDLGGNCITPNDNDSMPPAGDPANRLQNFPVLTGAIGGHFKGTISGTLTSTPGDYRIEFFGSPSCDASGYGQGYFYLGHTTITLPNLTVNGQTTVSFSKTLSGTYQVFPSITVTATAQASGVANDTSEFSACFPYTDDTIFANGFDPGIF